MRPCLLSMKESGRESASCPAAASVALFEAAEVCSHGVPIMVSAVNELDAVGGVGVAGDTSGDGVAGCTAAASSPSDAAAGTVSASSTHRKNEHCCFRGMAHAKKRLP